MEMASPDLEKQGFFAVVFVNREYNGQPDLVAPKSSYKIKILCNEVMPKLNLGENVLMQMFFMFIKIKSSHCFAFFKTISNRSNNF
jgi:hypothetical protein